MTTIVHGSPFTVSGSGFGTKVGTDPNLWDNCSHGDAWSVRYDRRWHDAGAGDVPYEEDYRDPSNYPAGNGIALPHARTTKTLCGTDEGVNFGNVFVSKDYTRPSSTEWWTVLSYYFRTNGARTFGGDDNFKVHFMAAGGNFPAVAKYAYIEFQNSGFTSNSVTGFQISWHDAALIGSSPQFNDTGSYPSNPCQRWQKVELVIHYKTSAGGLWKWRVDQTQMANVTLQTHDSGAYAAQTTWQESIGGFSRNRGANNAQYYCDIYRDVQLDHPGRFYLTDSATWGSETINEIQRWSGSWTPTSVPLVCNAGALSNGTVHLHYRDEVNGDQYLGTFTLADSGGGGGASSSSPIVPRSSMRIWNYTR